MLARAQLLERLGRPAEAAAGYRDALQSVPLRRRAEIASRLAALSGNQ
jgi:predicted RNA polymerase sigma factor